MSASNDQGVNTVTWRPHVSQVGTLPRPNSQTIESNLLTQTSLKHDQPVSVCLKLCAPFPSLYCF